MNEKKSKKKLRSQIEKIMKMKDLYKKRLMNNEPCTLKEKEMHKDKNSKKFMMVFNDLFLTKLFQ